MPTYRRTSLAVALATFAAAGLGSAASASASVDSADLTNPVWGKVAHISYRDDTDQLCVKTRWDVPGRTVVTMTSQRYGTGHQIATSDAGGDNVPICTTKPAWTRNADSFTVRGNWSDGGATGYFCTFD